MKGTELIEAVIAGTDAGKILTDALTAHIYTGESLDTLLGLRANGDGRRSPRVRVLLQARGAALLAAWEATRDHYEVSDYKACQILYDFLTGSDSPPIDIEPLIEPIEAYSGMLDINLGSPTALYNAVNNLLAAV